MFGVWSFLCVCCEWIRDQFSDQRSDADCLLPAACCCVCGCCAVCFPCFPKGFRFFRSVMYSSEPPTPPIPCDTGAPCGDARCVRARLRVPRRRLRLSNKQTNQPHVRPSLLSQLQLRLLLRQDSNWVRHGGRPSAALLLLLMCCCSIMIYTHTRTAPPCGFDMMTTLMTRVSI